MTKQSTEPKGGSKAGPATNREPREEQKPEVDEKAAPKETEPKRNGQARQPKKPKEPKEELVVFAFRLSRDERELIHRAAGAARASRFVRAVALAAACDDRKAMDALLESVRTSRGE
jgi:hypothetical protein